MFHPFVDTALDGSDVPRARDRRYVDVAVVEQHLYVVSSAEDIRVLVVLVRQHDELHRLPRVLHLNTTIKVYLNVDMIRFLGFSKGTLFVFSRIIMATSHDLFKGDREVRPKLYGETAKV